MTQPPDHRRDLIRLTYLIVSASFVLSLIYLLDPRTSDDLRGAIWTVWGGSALVTAIGFWLGSSAGRGRNLGPPRDEDDEK